MERLDQSDFNTVIWLIRHVLVFEGVATTEHRVYGPSVTLSPSAETEAKLLGWDFAGELFASSGIRGDSYGMDRWPVYSSPYPRSLLTAAGFLCGMGLAWDSAETVSPWPLFESILDEEPFLALDELTRIRLREAEREMHSAPSGEGRLKAIHDLLRAIQRATLFNGPEWIPLQARIVQAIQNTISYQWNIAITPALADFAMPDPLWWGEPTAEYKSRPRDEGLDDTPLDPTDLTSIRRLRRFLDQRLADTDHPFQFMFAHDSVLRAMVAIGNEQDLRTRGDLRGVGHFPPGTILGIRAWDGEIRSIVEFPVDSRRSTMDQLLGRKPSRRASSKELLRRQTGFTNPGHWTPYTSRSPIYQPPPGTPALERGTVHEGFPVGEGRGAHRKAIPMQLGPRSGLLPHELL